MGAMEITYKSKFHENTYIYILTNLSKVHV
ncbi:hypothetical protein IMSAG192_01539 [Muribaculaceae bacterium]|nr:hypothetical protein IMSAG192_01539 [Muribaculaceae bacterium]